MAVIAIVLPSVFAAAAMFGLALAAPADPYARCVRVNVPSDERRFTS